MTGDSDCDKLDAAMQSLWHLGIIALHDAGPRRGDGWRACRQLYGDAGGPDSGHLGFCYYRRVDRDRARHTRTLELVCGDFANKSLVTRKIQELIKHSLRAAGLKATARGSSNRVTLHSFRAEREGPPPPPPLHVKPQPPDELIAATTAVPAPSARRKRSLLTSGVIPESPLEKVRNMVLGFGAPSPIPDVPGTPGSEGPRPGVPGTGRRPAPKLTRSAQRAVGIGLAIAGLALIAVLWGTPRMWLGGVVFLLLGIALIVLGRGAEPR